MGAENSKNFLFMSEIFTDFLKRLQYKNLQVNLRFYSIKIAFLCRFAMFANVLPMFI